MITAHKSNLLRLWNLKTNEVIRTIKSFHTLPINILEINKGSKLTNDELSKENNSSPQKESEIDQSDLHWVTISGATLKFWNAGGNQVSKAVNIDKVSSLAFAKWDTKEKSARLFAADRSIYVIEDQDGSNQYSTSYTLEGHYSQVTGLDFSNGETMVRYEKNQAPSFAYVNA